MSLMFYKCTFEEFEKGFLEEASLEHHEDYVEWGFWHDVYKESEAVLDTYRFFLGEGGRKKVEPSEERDLLSVMSHISKCLTEDRP